MNIRDLFLKYSWVLYIFFIILVGTIVLFSQPKKINVKNEKLILQNYEYGILEVRKKEIVEQGYENVYFEINPIVQRLDEIGLKYNYRVDLHGTVKKAIINKYIYYAKFYVVKVDNKDYIFKNKQLSENFIKEIKKYTKEDYEIKNLILLIGKESSQNQIDNIIKQKKEAYEKALAEAAARKKRNHSSRATSGSKAEYQNYAHNLVINTYGWTEYDFECLIWLWDKESKWNPNAHNKSSGAHGIPQALPASKMASEGADYYISGYTQIRWGLKYIKNRYGSPSNAWAFFERKHWY